MCMLHEEGGGATKAKLPLVAVVAALAVSPFFAQPRGSLEAQGIGVSEAWLARYDGPAGRDDVAVAMSIDATGDVYVTGSSHSAATSQDFATIEYDSAGNELWVARYNGPGNGVDLAHAIDVDTAGNVYVTGSSMGVGTHSDYVTLKYSTAGEELWMARYDGPGSGYDYAEAMALDAAGNVYVTGYSPGLGTSSDYATIKYDTSGNELWVARYNGPGDASDYAYDIAVDHTGSVYVTGASWGLGTYEDYATLKYDTSGNQLWVARYSGPTSEPTSPDIARALAVDAAGNVYITGESDAPTSYTDYATLKYDPWGNQLWVARYNGPANVHDWARAIAVDDSGNAYVTGASNGLGTAKDYATIKYDQFGSEVWVARYNGPGNWYDEAHDVAVDNSGNVYVTGESDGDYATMMYDASGNDLWVMRHEDRADRSYALAVDGAGGVYVTGASGGGSITYDYDFVTIKYITFSDSDSDGMPDLYEQAYSCLDAAVNDATTDPDADGLANLQEYRGADGIPASGDETNPCLNDTDGDGCADGEDLGSNPALGGTRDPLNPYDFYDVPVPTAFNGGTLADRDQAVSVLSDVLAVFEYAGCSDGGPANGLGREYNQDMNGDGEDDGLLYDRSAGTTWSDAPDGAITVMVDVLLVLAQSGHSCQAPPPPTPTATPTATLSPTVTPTPSTTPTPTPTPNPAAIDAAIQATADLFGVPAGSVEVISVEARDWPDTCLGLGEVGEICLPMVTPGYRITLSIPLYTPIWRTDEDGSEVRLEAVEPA